MSISNNITEGLVSPPLSPENAVAEYKAGPRQRQPTHPGRILRTALADAGLNAAKAAPMIGTTKVTLGRIMAEENPAPVTIDMALRLGTFFGNGAELWIGLQTDYDLWNARERMQSELATIKPVERSPG